MAGCVRRSRVTGGQFAVESRVSQQNPNDRLAPVLLQRACACALAVLLLVAPWALAPGEAQTAPTAPATEPVRLPRIKVDAPRPKRTAVRAVPGRPGPAQPAPTQPAPAPRTATTGPGDNQTPLNGSAVATSASRLGLTVRETPATVEVLDRQTIQEQGYRTTAETANGATGVLSVDSAGAPAGFSMRGFTFGEVNVLYNGISTGPQSITSRPMDTANLAQVEFLKGPSALMSGLDAIGGSVNFVNRQPTSGPIKSELDLSIDSLGTARSHYGSGGSTTVEGLDYRFDVIGSHLNGFTDDTDRNLSDVAGQLHYRVNDQFKVFAAIEYKQDEGHAYWGTPMVPTSFAGGHAISGVVSGNAISVFDGVSVIGPMTIDDRTLHNNYNVSDNSTGAHDLWLRSGFEWSINNQTTLKNQTYYYQAERHWIDSETYAFDIATNMIDRDRFFVSHDQHLVGNNTDLTWDQRFLGMDNRFASQVALSSNKLTFTETDFNAPVNANIYPADTVDVVNPAPGVFGPLANGIRDKRLDDAALSFEDRLKPLPWLGLIGGLRFEHISLESRGINFDGTDDPDADFTQTWNPVSYRAGVTVEPIRNLTLYAMTATSYDPAAAGIYSIAPGSSVELTKARIYEVGVKQLLWDDKAEWTLAAYNITRNNVYVFLTNAVATLAGEVDTKGVEMAAAVRPIEGLKLWSNVAFTQAQYKDFDVYTGNTPSNVAPLIANAGISYRWEHLRWPVEIGGSARYVGRRFVFEDDMTTMDPYVTADLYAFVDIPGRDFDMPKVDKARIAFRVRNVTNTVYAAFSDPGYPDQVYLGAPRTYEIATSLRW
jgi:iron complex outermembrane recepter protein